MDQRSTPSERCRAGLWSDPRNQGSSALPAARSGEGRRGMTPDRCHAQTAEVDLIPAIPKAGVEEISFLGPSLLLGKAVEGNQHNSVAPR